MKGISITMSVAAIAMGAGYAQSALLPDMDYEYSGDAVPESSTPAWARYYDGDYSASAGILTVTTPGTHGGSDPSFLEFQQTGSWLANGAGSTVEVRLKTDANAPGFDWAGSLFLSTGTQFWGLLIGENYITALGVGDYAITTDDTFHTYRFVVSNEASGSLSMYVDGNTTPAHTFAGTPSGSNLMVFGDSSSASQGQIQWDYIQWTNDGAFAPVPEPAALSLLSLGALALRRRK